MRRAHCKSSEFFLQLKKLTLSLSCVAPPQKKILSKNWEKLKFSRNGVGQEAKNLGGNEFLGKYAQNKAGISRGRAHKLEVNGKKQGESGALPRSPCLATVWVTAHSMGPLQSTVQNDQTKKDAKNGNIFSTCSAGNQLILIYLAFTSQFFLHVELS